MRIVSVPIWGLFNLTLKKMKRLLKQKLIVVSVPIWGLFNLTQKTPTNSRTAKLEAVSVPIWGLFNLTPFSKDMKDNFDICQFPSPSGDYLI